MRDSSRQNLKVPCWESVEVGEELVPTVLRVTEHEVKKFAFAVDDQRDWHVGRSSPFGGPVAHAALLLPHLLRLWNTRFDHERDVGLHQREEAEFLDAVPVGEYVELTGRVEQKYVKRGKEYVVTASEARSQSGRVVVRHRATEVIAMESTLALGSGSAAPTATRWVKGDFPERRPLITHADWNSAVGCPIGGPWVPVEQAQMSIFSNVDEFWHTTHTDIGAARRAGLECTLAQGLMGTCHLSTMATDLFGAPWFRTGRIEQSYLMPIYAGDALRARGVLIGVTDEADGRRLEFESWLDNQREERVAVGWFSAVVPALASEPKSGVSALHEVSSQPSDSSEGTGR